MNDTKSNENNNCEFFLNIRKVVIYVAYTIVLSYLDKN